MPRRPSFAVKDTSKLAKPKGWLVHVPASLSAIGKLERRYFEKEKDANVFAAKLRTQYHKGIRGGVVSVITAHGASQAEEALRKAGLDVSLIEAVRSYIDAREALSVSGLSVLDAAKSVAKKYENQNDRRTFAESAGSFITEKEMVWSKRYCRDIEQVMRALPSWFLETQLVEIDEPMVEKVTKEIASTPTVIATRMRQIKSLVSGKGRKGKSKPPTILTLKECAGMLRACNTIDERRAVALLLFAGIRPDSKDGEITKLEWSAFRDGKIYISPAVSKTDTERIIPIRPRLSRLIAGHPKKGGVLPTNWQRRVQAIRKEAGLVGFKYQDATRHCFASHHLTAYGESSTQAAMGHAEGSRTLFKHYISAVTEEQGIKYFR